MALKWSPNAIQMTISNKLLADLKEAKRINGCVAPSIAAGDHWTVKYITLTDIEILLGRELDDKMNSRFYGDDYIIFRIDHDDEILIYIFKLEVIDSDPISIIKLDFLKKEIEKTFWGRDNVSD